MSWVAQFNHTKRTAAVFDARRSDTLIVAFHGYGQVPTGARWGYLDFARMSGLREWCEQRKFSLLMPLAPARRNWSEDTDAYALNEIHYATTQLRPQRLYIYGFSDGADQAMRVGKIADGVVFHSGVRVAEGIRCAEQILRNGKLALVATKHDNTPADKRVAEIAAATPAARHIVMPRRTWWGLNHYWTPETNDIVWEAVKAPAPLLHPGGEHV